MTQSWHYWSAGRQRKWRLIIKRRLIFAQLLFLTENRQQFTFIMNLMEVTRLCNGPILQIIQWLQRRNLLASPLRCAACNQAMQLTARNPDHVDGFHWQVLHSFLLRLFTILLSINEGSLSVYLLLHCSQEYLIFLRSVSLSLINLVKTFAKEPNILKTKIHLVFFPF